LRPIDLIVRRELNYGVNDMANPPFVMSKYLSKEDLYKDKAEYYRLRCAKAEQLLQQLRDRCFDEMADPEDVSEIVSATAHIKGFFDDDRLMIG